MTKTAYFYGGCAPIQFKTEALEKGKGWCGVVGWEGEGIQPISQPWIPDTFPFLSRFPVLVTQITFSKCKYRKMPTTKGSLYHSFFSPYHSIFLQAVHNITCPVLNENALVYSREVWFKYTKFPKYMLRFYFQPFSGRPSYFRFFWEKLS